MNNHLITRINLGIKKLNEYYKIPIFPVMLFIISSCTEKVEIVPECDPCTSPTTYIGYNTVFTEEFNGVFLNEVWRYASSNGGPGELQAYQDNNVTLRDGSLVLTAKKEEIGKNFYTSGRINTFSELSLTYGRIDVRAKLPKGQGLWPAIWLLGDNTFEVAWPKAGAIYLVEMRGGEEKNRDNTIRGRLSWAEGSTPKSVYEYKSLNNGKFNDKFHVFSIIWEPSKIQWLLNDKVYFEQKIDSSMNETFSKPFHLILNVAVGGGYPGNPDSNTIFPQEMIVDYIRVFQK